MGVVADGKCSLISMKQKVEINLELASRPLRATRGALCTAFFILLNSAIIVELLSNGQGSDIIFLSRATS